MLRSLEGLEIGGDLLFGFQTADVSFSLVVRERNTFDKSKSKPPVLMVGESLEQVSAFGVFGLTPFALYGRRFFAVGQLADMFKLPLPCLAVSHQDGCFLAVLIKVEHELVHFGRPFGTFFYQVGQFPEQVGTAQGMLALLEAEVRLPAVVHGPVLKIFEQRIATIQSLPAPFFVDEQVGEAGGGGDVEPMEAFFHPHARFIKMNHIRGQNRRFDLFLYGCKGLIHARIGRHGGTFIERTAPQVAHELFDLPQRQFVVVVQQDAQRLDPATVLNGLAHFGRKGYQGAVGHNRRPRPTDAP